MAAAFGGCHEAGLSDGLQRIGVNVRDGQNHAAAEHGDYGELVLQHGVALPLSLVVG